jgi:flagellar biosynthesis/type III secretory pathway ATPase
VDEAIAYQPRLEAFLSQDRKDSTSLEAGYAELARILGADETSASQAKGVAV